MGDGTGYSIYTTLAKYDSSGTELWVKNWRREGDDLLLDVAVDGEGNVWTSGNELLIKYDSSGTELWSAQLETLSSVAADGAGNVYTFSLSTPFSVSKYDSTGNQEWVKQLGSADWYCQDVAADSAGNVYMTGITYGNAVNLDPWVIWVAKYDSSGTLHWSAQPGLFGYEDSLAVTVDGAGNVYIAGSTNRDFAGNNAGSSDAWAAKYDSSGNLQWLTQLGTASSDGCNDVAVDSAGNVYLTICTDGDFGGSNTGNRDAWVAKLVQPATPTVANNRVMTLEQGATSTITSNELKVTDAGGDAITYTLTALPANGTLKLNNKILAVSDTFTQGDIDAGNLSYTHSGSLFTNDQFKFLASNGNSDSITSLFTIKVNPVSGLPTNIILSSGGVVENCPNGTFIGNLTTIDPDPGDTHTYTLVSDADGRFTLDGDRIVVADGSLLDSETATSHTIRVRSTDSGTHSFEKDFTISVLPVNTDPAGYLSPTVQWIKQKEGATASNVAVDIAGNSYMWDTSQRLKYDSNGTLQWEEQSGGGGDNISGGSLDDVALDSAGNRYVSSQSYRMPYDSFMLTPEPEYSVSLTKYDPSGNELWSASEKGKMISSVTADSAGNVYLLTIAPGYWNEMHSDQYFILPEHFNISKYDATGNQLSVTQFEILEDMNFADLRVDSAGNFYVTTLHSASMSPVLAKYDSSGTELWVKGLGSGATKEVHDFTVDSAGNVYVTGCDLGDWAGGSPEGNNAWVAKWDSSGTELWSAHLGGIGEDRSYGLAVDSAGNVYISGDTEGSLAGQNAGSYDAWVAMYSSSGNQLWAQQLGSAGDDRSNCVAADGAGNVWIAGSTSGDLGGSNVGGTAFWAAKLGFNNVPAIDGTPSTGGGADSMGGDTGTPSTGGGADSMGGSTGTPSTGGGADSMGGDTGTPSTDGSIGDDTVAGGTPTGSAGDTAAGGTGTGSTPGPSTTPAAPPTAEENPLNGTQSDDSITGSDGRDTLAGNKGDDSLNGGKGADLLFGNQGDDLLDGGLGADTVCGGKDSDTLTGSEGDDNLYGDSGNDLLFGNTGADKLDGGAGDDTLCGGQDRDSLTGSDGNDTLAGNKGSDSLAGGDGNDWLCGNQGADTLNGGSGNDTLFAGKDSDSLTGSDGDDFLCGDLGSDTLTGGTGSDRFSSSTAVPFTAAAGVDTITDFLAGTDKILLSVTVFASITSVAGTGFSSPGEFATVGSDGDAAASSALIVYNSVSGNLFYNQNGSAEGFGEGGQFATLSGNPALTPTDFIIQAW